MAGRAGRTRRKRNVLPAPARGAARTRLCHDRGPAPATDSGFRGGWGFLRGRPAVRGPRHGRVRGARPGGGGGNRRGGRGGRGGPCRRGAALPLARPAPVPPHVHGGGAGERHRARRAAGHEIFRRCPAGEAQPDRIRMGTGRRGATARPASPPRAGSSSPCSCTCTGAGTGTGPSCSYTGRGTCATGTRVATSCS